MVVCPQLSQQLAQDMGTRCPRDTQVCPNNPAWVSQQGWVSTPTSIPRTQSWFSILGPPKEAEKEIGLVFPEAKVPGAYQGSYASTGGMCLGASLRRDGSAWHPSRELSTPLCSRRLSPAPWGMHQTERGVGTGSSRDSPQAPLPAGRAAGTQDGFSTGGTRHALLPTSPSLTMISIPHLTHQHSR